ncbi:hypothetical protein J7E73_23760 [Paenibacillus albidus]|uniref:hypothetical protein n=1 Tax=Paenibacillus albidus TaxID=2041023 RepID=UPI001BE9A5C5|nr:hypothetical protein [Paenibacillus albidus]MBT2292095.1 hypothetical protein [Paenibacillus albidus]
MNSNHDSFGTKRTKKRRMMIPLLLSAILLVPYGHGAMASESQSGSRAAEAQTAAALEKTPLKKKTASGEYQGLADGHTVEISVYGEPLTLQFGEKLESSLADLEIGDPVVFTYTEQKFVHDPVVLICHLISIREPGPGDEAHNARSKSKSSLKPE